MKIYVCTITYIFSTFALRSLHWMTLEPSTSPIYSSGMENEFNIATALSRREEYDKALFRFIKVCESIQKVVEANPEATVELHLIPLSLLEMSKIHEKRGDLQREYLTTHVSNMFLEYIGGNAPNHDSECSPEYPEHRIDELFRAMHEAFAAPPTKKPQDLNTIIERINAAKRLDEEKQARDGYEMLKQKEKERKYKLQTSRWARLSEFISTNPIAFCVILATVTIVYGIIAVWIVKDDSDKKHVQKQRPVMEEPKTNKKMTIEELQTLMDNIIKERKDESSTSNSDGEN